MASPTLARTQDYWVTPSVSPADFGRMAGMSIESWVATIFAGIWLLGVFLGFPVNVPDAGSLGFVLKHYFSPLFVAFALQVPVAYLAAKNKKADPLLMLKLLPFMMLVVFFHFNFKAWMPLVNPALYDQTYQEIDELLWPVVGGLMAIRSAIAARLPVNADDFYHGLFVAMFFVSVGAHAVFDNTARQRQLILGVCLILLLGGVLYWVAPALGPFLYRSGSNEASIAAQDRMKIMFDFVAKTRRLPPGYFCSAPAAMPSLHVAHALFLTLFAARSLRWLLPFYLPILFWIIIESVTSGWHYLVDIPAGVVLTLLCYVAVRHLIAEPVAPEQTA